MIAFLRGLAIFRLVCLKMKLIDYLISIGNVIHKSLYFTYEVLTGTCEKRRNDVCGGRAAFTHYLKSGYY